MRNYWKTSAIILLIVLIILLGVDFYNGTQIKKTMVNLQVFEIPQKDFMKLFSVMEVGKEYSICSIEKNKCTNITKEKIG